MAIRKSASEAEIEYALQTVRWAYDAIKVADKQLYLVNPVDALALKKMLGDLDPVILRLEKALR